MSLESDFFFCGVGGSGMAPLALIVKARGARVEGSDRALDQGRTSAKFDWLRAQGIALHPQDGSGITRPEQVVVASAAVEDGVPDMVAARRVGAHVLFRPELLSRLFNAAPTSVGVAGTSGKSTVTGMIASILQTCGRAPTVMNGAVMKSFVSADAPYASALVGREDLFVSEVDESDGSIAGYAPTVAVVNNVALDHKSMDELRTLFAGFVEKARTAVLNRDNAETAALAQRLPSDRRTTYSLVDAGADLYADDLRPQQDGIAFRVRGAAGETAEVALRVPGRHNVSNALAAIAAARACGVPFAQACAALAGFAGIKRRLDVVGTRNGVTVIDDFAHNPDKIAATLETLHAFPGRLLVLFQPHGYGPLKQMGEAFARGFADGLASEDLLLMPEPVYYGGTVDRSVGSEAVASRVRALGRTARALPDRAACGESLLALAKPGDRIVVMGARDDTLSEFAADLLAKL